MSPRTGRVLYLCVILTCGALILGSNVLSLLDQERKWWWKASDVFTIFTFTVLPLIAIMRHWKAAHAPSASGFAVGDKVVLRGDRGKLVGHPMSGYQGAPDLNLWLVAMDDGRLIDEVPDRELHRPSAVDLLGDIVRRARA